MGDANVRRPVNVATCFEPGVDFGLLVHKSPFMADKREPLVLSNYIFELLEVNPGVAGFLIQLHPEDVDAVLESVTAHAEKGAGTKTTLYVGQEEEEVEWRQVGEYAAVTDFVWLRRMNLVLDGAKKEGQGMCPCHQV